MFLKFLIFISIVFFSDNCWCTFFARDKQVEANFEYVIGGREIEEEKNYNFPEFEKAAEFLIPLIEKVENQKCRKQLGILVKSLKNSSLWAVQMFDASTKTLNGVLASDAYEFGNYDACTEINLKRGKEDNIVGKYCLINFSTKKLHISPSMDKDAVPEIQLWEKLMIPIFKYGFINDLCRSAICVPNECLPEDIENVFRFLFNNTSRHIQKEIGIHVPENACSIANGNEFLGGLVYVKKITALIFLWVAAVTTFELLGWFSKTESFWIKIQKNFSAYKNFKILAFADCRKPVLAVNSLKVYAVVALVIVRRVSLFLAIPIINRKEIDQIFDESLKENFFLIISNIIADTFLVLDGFLHFYRVFSYYRKNPKINIFRIYAFQFLNMCSLYIATILFHGFIFETIGTGPIWREKTEKLVKNCRENWMMNLMNLNNFLRVSDMCIFESWHFAVAAQCFIIVPILAKITQKTFVPVKFLFRLLIGAGFVLITVKFYYFPDSSRPFTNDSGEIYWHQKLSTETLNRAPAYFIGIVSSLLYLQAKENELEFSKICDRAFFKAASGTLFVIFCAQLNFTNMTPLQKAYIFYFRQIIWCLLISYVILGVSTKRMVGIAPLLTKNYLVPLGRLSFSYLLVLDVLQIYSVGIMRTLDYFSFSRMIWITSADLLATYVVAFIFYMIVHRPVSNILHEIFINL